MAIFRSLIGRLASRDGRLAAAAEPRQDSLVPGNEERAQVVSNPGAFLE
jgi:hypothetical protein